MVSESPQTRLTRVLEALGVARSAWYRRANSAEARKRPGPRPQTIDPKIVEAVVTMAQFRKRYNSRRPHWALIPESGGDPLVPEEVYVAGHSIQIPKWQTWAQAAQAKLEALLTEEAA